MVQIIKEYEVEDGNMAITIGYKTYGPFKDAEAHLLAMGAKADSAFYIDEPGGHPGDWEYGTIGSERGPYIIWPEGWDREEENKGLTARIFAISELGTISELS